MGICWSRDGFRGGKQAVGGGPGGPTEAHNTGGGTNNDAVDFFYRSRGLHGLFTQIELSLSASKLRDRDITSKSDPMAVAYVKKRDGTLEEIGRTEVIMNSLNPAWIVKVSIAYQFEIVQPLVFHVYDVDNHNVPVKMLKLNELDFLGKASCDLSEIMTKQNRTLTLNLHDKSIVGVSRNLGTLSVYAEETVASRSAVEISFRCSHLANVDLLSKSSDPMADVYVRMRKPNVANGKEGVGRAKPDGGKPSECGTSRTSEKKRKRKPESEFSTSSDEDEDADLAAQNIGLKDGEANRVLSDKAKRSVYDLKFRTVKAVAPKSQAQTSQRNTFRKQQTAASNFHNAPHSQYGATNNVPKPPFMQFAGVHPSQNADKTTFWICCGNCNIRCKYLRTHVNKVLRCQSCQQSFTAYDLGSRGVPPGQPWSHFPNQNGIPNPPFQNGFSNPGPSKVRSQSNPSKVAFQSNRGKPSATTQEKVEVRMNVKDGVRMHKPNVANGKVGVGQAKPDGGKPSECGTSRTSEKKRKRKPESEFSTSSDEDEDVDLAAQNIGLNTGNPTRRSSRQKQNVPYNENKNDDDDFVSPAKRSKPSNVSEGEVNEAGAGKDKDDATTLQYPDPEFSDFDKDRAEHCFAVNQLWAIYDTCDGMPRFYARIKKVFSPFKLQITWLEADPDDESENDWCEEDLPVACGKFMNGSTEGTEDRLMFSHQISFIESAGRNSFWIYPKKGETWALFKDWDIKRSSDPEKHKPPYRYEFVEVVADFNKDDGIVVAYLGKVKGFVSIFQRIAKNGVVSFRVAPRELYRFSHQIPSFRMTGKEREGVPEGSFELDPASLPTNPD